MDLPLLVIGYQMLKHLIPNQTYENKYVYDNRWVLATVLIHYQIVIIIADFWFVSGTMFTHIQYLQPGLIQ